MLVLFDLFSHIGKGFVITNTRCRISSIKYIILCILKENQTRAIAAVWLRVWKRTCVK